MQLRQILSLGLGAAVALARTDQLQPRGNPCDPSCQRNACLSAVVANDMKPSPKQAYSDCVSLVRTTVTGSPVTTTVTVSNTVTGPKTTVSGQTVVTATTVSTEVSSTTTVTTVTTPSTISSTTATTTTVFTSLSTIPAPPARVKRSSQAYAYSIPKYASKCTNIPAYESACKCISAIKSTVTVPRSTRTITVTKSTTVAGSTVTSSSTSTAVVTQVMTTVSTIVSTATEPSRVTTTVSTTVTSTQTLTPTPRFILEASGGFSGGAYLKPRRSDDGNDYLIIGANNNVLSIFYLNSQSLLVNEYLRAGFVYNNQSEYSLLTAQNMDIPTTEPEVHCTIGNGPFAVGQTGMLQCSFPPFSYFQTCDDDLVGVTRDQTSPSCSSGPIDFEYRITGIRYYPA